MITVVRSSTFAPEKGAEAVKARVKRAKYVTELTGNTYTVLRNTTGQLNQVHTVAHFESMAAWENEREKVWDDAGFQELWKEGHGSGLYTDSSITIYEQVE